MKKILLFALLATFATASFAAKKESSATSSVKKSLVSNQSKKQKVVQTVIYLYESECGWWTSDTYFDIDADFYMSALLPALNLACEGDLAEEDEVSY